MKVILPLVFAFIIIGSIQAADSWQAPEPKVYYSFDSTYFIRIVPRIYTEKYWEWVSATDDEKKDFKPSDTLVVPCQATMYKKTVFGDSILWTKNLKNTIAPVSAFVSDDGKYLATFDNWHSVGLGENVFVYYNEKGEVLKSHTLKEISPFPVNFYERTISSLWWSCGMKFIDTKRIEICFINRDKEVEKIIYNLENQRIE